MELTREVIKNSIFINNWKEKYSKIFSRMYPTISIEVIKKYLDKVIVDNMKYNECALYNEYNDKQTTMSNTLSLYDFIKGGEPIAGGNGTLFMQHKKRKSPISEILEIRAGDRSRYKNTMAEIGDTLGVNSYEYIYYDILQQEAKIAINAIYGAFGTKTFQLYDLATVSSITATAQSLISATAIGFEGFLSNNTKFKTLGECMNMMLNIVSENYTTVIPNEYIITDTNKVYKHLVRNFMQWKNEYEEPIYKFLSNCNTLELTKIYYKNNLYEFSSISIIKNLIKDIFNSVSDFTNPNNVPNEIKDKLKQLWNIMNEWVFYNYSYTERINRLKNDTRRSVILVDTDSNILNLDPWVRFIKEIILHTDTLTNEEENISVNILAYIITNMVNELLNKYCMQCNVDEEHRSGISMKNELYIKKLLLSMVKKRWAAIPKYKEGHEFNRPIIKGHDFIKASVTEDTSKIFEDILVNTILLKEKPDLDGMLARLDAFEQEIKTSLKRCEKTYLLRANCKVLDAYVNPYSMMQVLSVLVWNAIYPNNSIEVPTKAYILLINLNQDNVSKIKQKYPKEYTNIVKYLFNGKITKLQNNIKYVAIPDTLDKIPEMFLPFIQYESIVSRNMATFKSVRESLSFVDVSGTKSSGVSYFSNIIDI